MKIVFLKEMKRLLIPSIIFKILIVLLFLILILSLTLKTGENIANVNAYLLFIISLFYILICFSYNKKKDYFLNVEDKKKYFLGKYLYLSYEIISIFILYLISSLFFLYLIKERINFVEGELPYKIENIEFLKLFIFSLFELIFCFTFINISLFFYLRGYSLKDGIYYLFFSIIGYYFIIYDLSFIIQIIFKNNLTFYNEFFMILQSLYLAKDFFIIKDEFFYIWSYEFYYNLTILMILMILSVISFIYIYKNLIKENIENLDKVDERLFGYRSFIPILVTASFLYLVSKYGGFLILPPFSFVLLLLFIFHYISYFMKNNYHKYTKKDLIIFIVNVLFNISIAITIAIIFPAAMPHA